MANWVVLSMCDLTGVMVEPWIQDGCDAILVDPQHPSGITVEGKITRIGQIIDHPTTWSVLREVLARRRVAFAAGFPPCTDLAVSGARWFEEKAQADPWFQYKAMHIVWQCQIIAELTGAPYMIENPISRISSFWRKPDYSFHPYWFTAYAPQDNYTKKTCLWTGGGFHMPAPNIDPCLPEPDNRIHTAVPSPERANFRSATPRGFAIAVFKANGEI